MGDPIPDLPPPDVQDAAGVDAGFAPGPPAISLCGFKLPLFLLALKYRIPGLNLPIPFPIPKLAIGLSCDLSNPISVTAGVPAGGGRKATFDKDPDEDYDNAA
jgi:hypothetical protein